MSTNEVDVSARPAPSHGGLRGFTDRWPFRRKLNVLVGVPLTAVAVLLAYLIAGLATTWNSAASAAQLVRDSTQVARLVNRVEAEHQQAILLSVRHEAETGGTASSLAAYRSAQAAVNSQIELVRSTFGDRLPDTEAQALKDVEGLTSLRETVERGYLPADNIDPAYTGAAQGLISGLDLEHNPALASTFTGNLLDSLLRADAAHSAFETGVFSATTGDSNALIEFTGAVGSYEQYTYQADRFARFATDGQASELSGMDHTAAQREIAQAYAELQVDPSGLQANTPADVRRSFTDALNDYPAYQQQAENRLKVTASLIGQIADQADAAVSSAQWRAGLLLFLALIGFVVWIAVAALVRRSVVRPVQVLTGAAQEIADIAGRELARVADDDAEEDEPRRLRQAPVTARDEIGELAEAFNRVQATGVALLDRQVLSRRNVAEMFGNIGRRISSLTSRQLMLIDAVERGETDPALLERLYSIDHIAVRLRRNADSLMLLAGIRETVLDAGPTSLTNVVRAALGQIEGFQRVRLRAETEVMVEPEVIGDLTLMVAELMENAVSFSPVDSPVEVMVRAGGEGAVIEVADHGLGMSAERLAGENARLIRRERLDLVPTKVLGLFAVGTLARRWQIAVVLSRTPGGGVTVTVEIPPSLLLTSRGALREDAGAHDNRTSGPASARTTAAAARSVAAPDRGTAAPGTAEPGPEAGTGPVGGTERHDRAHPPDRAGQAPFVPRPRPGEAAAEPTDGARPLRRRVRGATLRNTDGAQPAAAAAWQAARPADAEAVRAALEEFEDAVERAHRDSATLHDHPTDPHETPHQNHLPEGAEQ